MKIISIREIADDKTTISSTRWAFATVIKVDIAIIVITLIAGLISHFVPCIDELPETFYGNVALLLGILTGIVTTSKALQGFEPYKQKDKPAEPETPVDIADEK